MKRIAKQLYHNIKNFFVPYDNEDSDVEGTIEDIEEEKTYFIPEPRRYVYGANDIFYDKLVHDKMKRMMCESPQELFTYEQVILLLEECQLQERAKYVRIFLKQFDENYQKSQYPENNKDLKYLAKKITDLDEEYFMVLEKRFYHCLNSKK